jgi:heme-degrading monooxygenase HmoA
MYVSMSRLSVDPARRDELVRAFGDRAHLVDEAPGFLDLEVWRSDRDATEIVMVSRWSSREDFTRYMQSDAHAVSHARITPSLQAAIKLERLDHLHTYDVVAR